MSYYVIGHIRVLDASRWADYRARVGVTLAPFGGELVMRGRVNAVLAGDWPGTDTVLLRFVDAASARAWHDSPAYQALVPLREAGADVVLVGYEGE
ncbi:DUF1330 domain-containing protein [Methyloversatilis sp.]|uniref:DUF1330 domain-containing protein n=1 Tax=Methyloversatilis sp. TaxID=2569862 RepID=UPI003D2C612C